MKLAAQEWGEGDRVAVLVHGFTSDSGSWLEVAPALVERGYRVIAPDLRGHGRSARGLYTPEDWAGDLVETLAAGPALAVGHSLGGLVLALAADRLRPARAVYEDPAWKLGPDPEGQRATAFRQVVAAGEAEIGAAHPRWSPAMVRAKWEGNQRFDAAAIDRFLGAGPLDHAPAWAARPSLVLLADPSDLVRPDDAAALRGGGFDIEVITGASHDIHRDDLPAFLHALDRWLAL